MMTVVMSEPARRLAVIPQSMGTVRRWNGFLRIFVQIRYSRYGYRKLAMKPAIDEILTMTTECYTKADLELAFRVEPLEQVIDKLTSTIKTNHIARLQKGGCSIEMGFILSDLLNNYERISDHCSNIAVAVIEVERGGFDTHEYLSGIKFGNMEFNQIYDTFDRKYSLE